ncbi:hypothetical protein [Streptosporangium sp. NPDC002524]|uniref:hypothetical protein n=1 Tax=Streptosporangium sp. NPDC002524 TaxID=3154537 RepID=UPI00332EA1BA
MRPQWEDLPPTVREAVEQRIGPILKAESVGRDPGRGVAVRLHTEHDSVFFTALLDNDPDAPRYGRARWAGTVFASLPPDLPVAKMLWSADAESWLLLIHEQLSGRSADLTPGSPDIPLVTEAVATLNQMLTPCPAREEAPGIAENFPLIMSQAEEVLSGPIQDPKYRTLFKTALDGFTPQALDGDTLLHYNLSSRNLRIVKGRKRNEKNRAYVTSWMLAARGAAWLDAAMLCPRLIMAGHSASQATALLQAVPAWRDAPRGPVAALAALWTLRRIHKARFGPPGNREANTRAALVGRDWLASLM